MEPLMILMAAPLVVAAWERRGTLRDSLDRLLPART
jgi:hypothetical protein